MTEITFHFNTPDKLNYAVRLLRKAVKSGARVVVSGADDQLAQLDALLWSFSPEDFFAHGFHDASPEIVSASPVLLGLPASFAPSSSLVHPVLVNLGVPVPNGFERFERLIELVGRDPDDRLPARDRWKHYASRGYELKRHDVADH